MWCAVLGSGCLVWAAGDGAEAGVRRCEALQEGGWALPASCALPGKAACAWLTQSGAHRASLVQRVQTV